MTNYVIASSKDWFKRYRKSNFENVKFHEINRKEQLTVEFLDSVKPRYVFFPHWHWMVPSDIYERYECVVFHTAPLPYGRGGSPIQNLIIQGLKTSPVCALRMTDVLDGGPIYDSQEISLDGTIEEIFARIAECVEKLIISICRKEPEPKDQIGEPVYFKRLTPSDNKLSATHSIKELYDRIRMVDGQDYPHAYIQFGDYKIELTEASSQDDKLIARAKIYRNVN